MKILNKIYLNLQNFYKKIILQDKYYSFSGVDIVLKKIFTNKKKVFTLMLDAKILLKIIIRIYYIKRAGRV